MESKVFSDKLLDLCETRAEDIARRWYKAICNNPHTPSYHDINGEKLITLSAPFYRDLKVIFFSENPYEEVERFLDGLQYVEQLNAQGIPLSEMIYSLILMRRHIWLYAELQGLFFDFATDIYQAVASINRVLLLFDYIMYTVIGRYEKISK